MKDKIRVGLYGANGHQIAHKLTDHPDAIPVAAAKLSEDFSHFISEPVELFRAKDASWGGSITDGCYMYTTEDGQLLMLWSTGDGYGYCVGIARSENGDVLGPWTHDSARLYSQHITDGYDGGHGMIFTDRDGQMYMSFHSPNSSTENRSETAVFLPIREENNKLVWDTEE